MWTCLFDDTFSRAREVGDLPDHFFPFTKMAKKGDDKSCEFIDVKVCSRGLANDNNACANKIFLLKIHVFWFLLLFLSPKSLAHPWPRIKGGDIAFGFHSPAN